jgi:predicted O-methyltransferase YrrM
VPESQGVFLYLCADGFSARRILELGTCAGISGCYLALTPSCRDFVSIEISAPLARVAEQNLRQVTSHATVINAPFNEGLGDALAVSEAPFDLIWIDGHHESEPTLRYFERLRDHASPGKLMLFDDINWPEMEEAWDAIRLWPGFCHTLNTGRLGIGVLKQQASDRPPQNWKLERRMGVTSLKREPGGRA